MKTTTVGIPASWENGDIPELNTLAVVDFAALTDEDDVGYSHVIDGVAWSYSAAPTAGWLQISDSTGILFAEYITAAGPGFIPFRIKAHRDDYLHLELSAAGAAVQGTLFALDHRLEP